MIKPCLWMLGADFLVSAVTWYCIGEISPAVWTICTSNGDIAWSAAALAVSLILLLIGKRPRKVTRPEHAAIMRQRA
jgi:hypothetical protein